MVYYRKGYRLTSARGRDTWDRAHEMYQTQNLRCHLPALLLASTCDNTTGYCQPGKLTCASSSEFLLEFHCVYMIDWLTDWLIDWLMFMWLISVSRSIDTSLLKARTLNHIVGLSGIPAVTLRHGQPPF